MGEITSSLKKVESRMLLQKKLNVIIPQTRLERGSTCLERERERDRDHEKI